MTVLSSWNFKHIINLDRIRKYNSVNLAQGFNILEIRSPLDIVKVEKYPILIFLTYRFLYGFRSITPLVIGASKIKTKTFFIYSALSTTIWASVYCTVGYLFGAVIKSELSHIEHIEKYIIGAVALLGIVIIIIKQLSKKSKLLHA